MALTKESDGKYYLLDPDTEITKEQYDNINAAAAPEGTSGDLSQANILRLHQEQDPASPFFKGSQPANGAITSIAADGSQETKSYYEPTADKLDQVADQVPEPQGTTVITTEQATKPYEAKPELAPEGLPVVETIAPVNAAPTPAPQVETPAPPVFKTPTQDDAGITGA
ncbi:unnamed protein product [Sphagnum balticum]